MTDRAIVVDAIGDVHVPAEVVKDVGEASAHL